MLNFDPITHIYTLDGVRIPSVTQVLQAAGLIDFGGIRDSVLEEAAKRGTRAHEAIEEWSKGHDVPDAWMFSEIEAWDAFCHDMKFESLTQEYQGADEILKVGFTIDQIGTIHGKTVIVDIKTGVKKISDIIQVCAYGLLHPVDRIFIAYLHGKRYKAVEIKGYDRNKGENIFKSALSLYHYRKREGLLCQQ